MATREPQFEPKTTEEARQVIETTRERISRDLDAIEGRLEATRDRIGATAERVKNKVNVLMPVSRQVRSHPWPSVGVALGTGVLLGLLAAGKDEEEREHEARRRKMLSAREREERRRWRARRRERLAERGFGAEEGKGRIRSMIGRQVRAAMAGPILGAIGTGLANQLKRAGKEMFQEMRAEPTGARTGRAGARLMGRGEGESTLVH